MEVHMEEREGVAVAQKRTRKELEQLAQKHLWMYFSELSSQKPSPIITRGEGCYVIDEEGKRYFDGRSGIFLNQVGHGRLEGVHLGQRLGQLFLDGGRFGVGFHH